MDWKDQLGALLNSGELPEGPDTPASPESNPETEKKKLPGLNVVFERKGRGGKSATIIEGFGNQTDKEIADLAARLKSRLGIGGSARGGEILLQGDQRSPRLKELLNAEGYKTKGI